jgi:type II secretory pathway component PulF
MPVFQYKAMQTDGTVALGQIEAGGRQDAFRLMEGRGLTPISLAEQKNGKTAGASERKSEANGVVAAGRAEDLRARA